MPKDELPLVTPPKTVERITTPLVRSDGDCEHALCDGPSLLLLDQMKVGRGQTYIF